MHGSYAHSFYCCFLWPETIFWPKYITYLYLSIYLYIYIYILIYTPIYIIYKYMAPNYFQWTMGYITFLSTWEEDW